MRRGQPYGGPLAHQVPRAHHKQEALFRPLHVRLLWLKQAAIILLVVLTFFTAPSVWTATNPDSSSGSQPEKLSVRSYLHPELRGQLQFSDKAAQRDPAQRLKDLKARMQRKADRELAQAQPPSQPPKPFQKAVLQVAAFFSFGPGARAKAGSGALITTEGHLLTNSHVIRLGPGFCASPPVQGAVAPLIILLVTENLQKPPIPRYVADFVTDDPQLDIAVLKISRELKEGLKNLQELEEKVSAAGSRDAFLNQWAKEGSVRSIPIQPLTLWDSDAALVGQQVTALGYPRPDDKLRNPSLNTDARGNIQAKLEGFLRVGAAFTAPGSSGGAVVRAEEGREYLIGLICAGEFGTGQGVARALPINAAVDGPIKAAQLIINQAPVAHFVPKPDLPRPRETVVFDALERSRDRDGSIQECQWQIKENGQSLTLPGCRVERSFAPDSRPKVTLTVHDDKGMSDAFTLEILLAVGKGPCRAKLRQASGAVQEFDSIQTAINQAGSGDVIEVIPPTPPRACAESVEIKGKRELTLRGARSIDEAPAFVLAGDGAKPTVLIADSESITLQGLTITQGNPGVRVENSRAIRVKQSIFKANRAHGIRWVNSSGRVSDDSRLEGNLADLDNRFGQGLMAEQKSIVDVIDTEIAGNAGAGITVLGESELKLEFAQVHGNNDGLVIDGAKQITLRDVRVRKNRKVGISAKNAALTIASSHIEDNREDGLSLTDVTAEIEENTLIARNRDGIEVQGTARLTLQNSRVSDNEGNGLFAWGSVQVSVTNSTIISSNKGIGLFLQDSAQITLANTQVFDNRDSGLSAGGDAVQVVLTNVQVLDNYSSGLTVWGSSTVSLTSSQVSGNGLDGLFVKDSATMEIKDNVFTDHEACGIRVISRKTQIRGTSNKMGNNGADLCGFAPASLRRPLVPTTNKTHLSVPGDFDSLQEAVDAITPGGTITVAAGVYKIGLTIWKPLRLRGAGHTQTVLKASRGLVVSIIAEAQRVQLEELMITGGSWYGLLVYSQAEFRDVQVSENGLLGAFDVMGSALVEITDSVIKDNKGVFSVGLFVGDSATVNIANAQVSGNTRGLAIVDLATVNLFNSQVSSNIGYGLFVRDSAAVSVRSSIIQGNGTDSRCQQADWICNGIEEWEEAQLTLSNSIIKDNTDWGVAASLKKCGYDKDNFTSKVVFEGHNVIEGNNKSGNHKGNPGNHPWNRPGVPDGQVCLP